MMTEFQNLELIPAKRLRVWGWPALSNFVMTGAAAGFCLVSFPLEMMQEEPLHGTVKLLPLILALAGFSALALEAGRPLRARYFTGNLRTSWMSREMLAGGTFISSLVMDYFYQADGFHAMVALSSSLVLISQGFMLYGAKAVPPWRAPLIPVFFMTSSLSSGAGIALLMSASGILGINGYLLVTGLVLAAMELSTWLSYLYLRPGDVFRQGTRALRSPVYSYFTLGIGNLFPMALLIYSLTAGTGNGIRAYQIVIALAGTASMAGCVWKKGGVILSANYLGAINANLPRAENRNLISLAGKPY